MYSTVTVRLVAPRLSATELGHSNERVEDGRPCEVMDTARALSIKAHTAAMARVVVRGTSGQKPITESDAAGPRAHSPSPHFDIGKATGPIPRRCTLGYFHVKPSGRATAEHMPTRLLAASLHAAVPHCEVPECLTSLAGMDTLLYLNQSGAERSDRLRRVDDAKTAPHAKR